MARLDCEDREFRSWFAIYPGRTIERSPDDVWQLYSLELGHGERKLVFESDIKDDFGNDGYLLCRKPRDEIAMILGGLAGVLSGKRPQLDFELSEPCFSIKVRYQDECGFNVEVFVDAGNVETGISRWDALGIRFFTTRENLEQFIKELKEDFAC